MTQNNEITATKLADETPADTATRFPFLPLRGVVVFPHVLHTFEVGRQGSIAALKAAMEADQQIFLVSQKDASTPWPDTDDLYQMGTLARIVEWVEHGVNEQIKVTVQGLQRGKLQECIYDSDVPYANVELLPLPSDADKDDEAYVERKEAMRRELARLFQAYSLATQRLSVDVALTMQARESAEEMTDLMISQMHVSFEVKISYLLEIDVMQRMEMLDTLLHREIRIQHFEEELDRKVRDNIDKGQQEYFLREQMRVIREQLGDEDDADSLVDSYTKQLALLNMPAEDKEKILKQIKKLPTYPPSFPETAILRSYLDTVLELPWGKMSDERLAIEQARKQLDRDHYGLKDVKERILEFLAVRRLALLRDQSEYRSPILCLVGPPGVGKTSIAQSIAKAMGREYVRMSLGGVRDEAEIRGHRRTYIGAMPGRIIQAIQTAGTDNPLILLDEIDKLASDYRGDPASALLEVLDPEQNHTFRDHYLELSYDLSHVLFVTTANDMGSIPDPLRDRMEIITLSGYTEHEKYEIAKRHLVPKTLKSHALDRSELSIPKATLMALIQGYTREAGVRQLEREIGKLTRKIALKIASGPEDEERYKVLANELHDYIGRAKYHYDKQDREDWVGMCTGLAWTAVGGDTLKIEVTLMPGDGKLALTGQLGDVMQESAQVAWAYLRSRALDLGIDPERFKQNDIHIHVPEGATPKDGPSAGITLATALCSALTGQKVRGDIAMTGELTLRGRVLPIGGLKEKLIAADRAGVKCVLIPLENEKDLDLVPESVLKRMEIIPVDHADAVFKHALRS